MIGIRRASIIWAWATFRPQAALPFVQDALGEYDELGLEAPREPVQEGLGGHERWRVGRHFLRPSDPPEGPMGLLIRAKDELMAGR